LFQCCSSGKSEDDAKIPQNQEFCGISAV